MSILLDEIVEYTFYFVKIEMNWIPNLPNGGAIGQAGGLCVWIAISAIEVAVGLALLAALGLARSVMRLRKY